MKLKGPLAREDEDYIVAYSREKSIKEIAKDLERPMAIIRRYIQINNLPTTLEDKQKDSFTRSELKDTLKNKAFYPQIRKQLAQDELVYFEELWIDALQQFDLDIRPTEELQLKRLLLLDIQADRINILKRQHADDLVKKQVLLNVELEKPSADRDRDIIAVLQSEIAAIRSAIQHFGREAASLVSESKHIQKDLKATRDQRTDTIDDSKVNFVSWLKLIQETKYRRVVGREMNVLKVATDKAKEKLGDYIEYADGKVDRQLLNEETVLRNEDSDN